MSTRRISVLPSTRLFSYHQPDIKLRKCRSVRDTLVPNWVIVTDRSGGGNHHLRNLQKTTNDVEKAGKDLISYRKVDNVYC